MPEKKIVEMPAEVTVIVDKVSEVTQSKDYGYDGSSWVPKKVDSSGRTEVTQTYPLNLMGVAYPGIDDSSAIKLIRTDTSGRPRIIIEQDSVGLAKDSTLSSIDGKITKCDTDNVIAKIVADDGTGTYGEIHRTDNSLHVKVTEQPVNSYTTDSITSVGNVLELNLGTFTATGASSSNDVYPCYRIITWQINSNSSGTAHDVRLQGSLDNSNWFDLDQSNTTGNEMRHVVNKPVRYLRVNVVSMGDATEIKVLALLKDA